MVNLKKLFLSSAVFILLLGLFVGVAYADELSGKTGVITGNTVNLRESPDTSAKVLDQLEKGTKVSVVKLSDNWYKITEKGITGWISADYLSIQESSLGTGYVTTETLNVRVKPDISSDLVTKVKANEKVTLLDKSDNWYKIKTSDGDIGWVSADYITTRKPSTSRGDSPLNVDEGNFPSGDDSSASDAAKNLIAYAKKFVGGDYVYGGDSPKEGFDCSGFTSYVFGHFSIDLDRTASGQAGQGVKVKKSELKAGDLVFFDTNGGHNGINHVGIYIGNGKFVHASSPRYGIMITDLSESYYERSYMTARRILR